MRPASHARQRAYLERVYVRIIYSATLKLKVDCGLEQVRRIPVAGKPVAFATRNPGSHRWQASSGTLLAERKVEPKTGDSIVGFG